MAQSERLRVFWWIVLAAFFVCGLSGRPWAVAVGGFVLASFALTVAVNFRGLGNSFPRSALLGPFRQEWSPAAIRATFGVLAAFGAFVCVAETVRLLA